MHLCAWLACLESACCVTHLAAGLCTSLPGVGWGAPAALPVAFRPGPWCLFTEHCLLAKQEPVLWGTLTHWDSVTDFINELTQEWVPALSCNYLGNLGQASLPRASVSSTKKMWQALHVLQSIVNFGTNMKSDCHQQVYYRSCFLSQTHFLSPGVMPHPFPRDSRSLACHQIRMR